MENVMLNEGMALISKRLDIFNIFEKIFKAEQRNEPLTNKVFPMTNECKTALKIMELEKSDEESNNEYIWFLYILLDIIMIIFFWIIKIILVLVKFKFHEKLFLIN